MRRRERQDRGAAAVEFALVVPILLMLVFGIIDYGLFFSNRLAVQQGVRDAVRQAVVDPAMSNTAACTMTWSVTPNSAGRKIGCAVVESTNPVVGTSYVKISLPDGWDRGEPLVVCEVVRTDGLTGFVPMPDQGYTTTKVQMPIEQDGSPDPTGGEQALPAGLTWSSMCPG